MSDHANAAITAEELYARPDHERLELVRGALRVCEPPGGRHGGIAARLAARLLAHADRHGLGTVLVEAGYVLRRHPDTVRGPDVSFVSATRMAPEQIPVAFIPGGPDLAIEVLSPDDRPGEVAERVTDYLEAGTRLVWVVDPEWRVVTIHRPGQRPETAAGGGTLDGQDVVPGFRCAVNDVFGAG